MRTHTIPLACSLLALIGLGGGAIAGESSDWGKTSADEQQDVGLTAPSVEFRAAHMVDGKDRVSAAKADRSLEPTLSDRSRKGSERHLWRAAEMRDRKDAVSAAKGADDRSIEDERLALSAPQGAKNEEAGERDRAAGMSDHKTSMYPKARVSGSDEASAGGREEDASRAEHSGPSPAASGSSSASMSSTSTTSSSTPTIAEPVAKPHQSLWNRGHDAPLSSAPTAVQATLAREAAGNEISSLSEKSENGRTIYDARIARPGSDDQRLKIAEDGSIVWRNDLKEQATAPMIQPAEPMTQAGEETSSTSTPAGPAKASAEQTAGGSASLGTSIEPSPGTAPTRPTPADQPVQDPGTVRANAEIDQAKMATVDDSSVAIDRPSVPAKDQDGWLSFGSGKRLAIDEVPKPVQEAIIREADGKPITRIESGTDDGKTVYKARIRISDARDLKLKLAEDGNVISRK